jgi:ABC-type transport system substrate-binding protein
LNAAGYVYSTDPTPAGWYDSEVPGSQPYYRIDPDTGVRMADFEYVTRPQAESPLYYEHSLILVEKFQAMGIPAILTPKTWDDIVYILINADPADYSLLTGVGIVWGSPAPDILYDFYESTQFPLWNIWSFNNATMDAYCHAMKATLDEGELKDAVFGIQTVLKDHVPCVPMMMYMTYTAFTGPYAGETGAIKMVNALGFGATASYNEFGKEFGESGRMEGGNYINKWYYGGVLDTLNPLMADTVPDWQCLDLVVGDGMRLNPYTHEYIWRVWEDLPDIQLWTGPLGELGMTLEYTIRDGVKWQDGTTVTADDCIFALNLMRFQNNERYLSSWQPIYDVVKTGPLSFKIWYLQRYLFAHEYFGISLYCPKHIWEAFVDDPPGSLVINSGAGPMGGDVWTSTGRHHSEFNPWEEEHPTVAGLTQLIGTDNFIYPPGGWEPGVGFHVDAWNHADNYMARINEGDCNFDGFTDMRDLYHVLSHQGSFVGDAFPEEIGGDPRWDPIADIADPAQKILGTEIFIVQNNFGIRWWPP